MKDQDFEKIVEDLLLYLYRIDYKDDGLIMAKNRIMYFLYRVCHDKNTFFKCMEVINKSDILEKELERGKNDRERNKS